MKQYDTYIFDFDGTLFDTRKSLIPVWNAGFSYLGYQIGEEKTALYMKLNMSQVIELEKIPKDKIEGWGKRVIEALDSKESISLITPYDETFETIKSLRNRGARCIIASGNTRKHIMMVLEQHHVESLFDEVVSAEDSASKPKPDVLYKAFALVPNLNKDKAVYVGDSLLDTACAGAAGIDGILVERNEEYGDYPGIKIDNLSRLLD